jgi:hypothetical protein
MQNKPSFEQWLIKKHPELYVVLSELYAKDISGVGALEDAMFELGLQAKQVFDSIQQPLEETLSKISKVFKQNSIDKQERLSQKRANNLKRMVKVAKPKK